MTHDSDPLVFSTDRSHRQVCPTCDRHPCVCQSAADVVPAETLLRMRLDKKGRGGKAVTVVFDLPGHPDYFLGLIKKLKAHCGTGGALKDGRIGKEMLTERSSSSKACLTQLAWPRATAATARGDGRTAALSAAKGSRALGL